MPSLFFVAFIAIASLQGTFGAPSCIGSKDLGSCVAKCKAKTGLLNHPTWGPPSNSNSSAVPTYSPAPAANPTGTPDNGKPSSKPASTSTPAAASTPSAASSSKSVSAASTVSNGSVSSADIEAYLSAHNAVRAQHGATALTWSDSLSSVAASWVAKCDFKHSGGQFGENLAAGTGEGYTIASAVKSWTDEVSQYNANNPVPSHFTQVVWKATTQVGCAVKDCNGLLGADFGVAHYHVCEYSPAGNVIGEFAQNVQA